MIITVGYELQEFDPVRINPMGDKQIIHIHRFPAEVDRHYNVAVGLQARYRPQPRGPGRGGRPDASIGGAASSASAGLLADELERGRSDDRFPLAPARIVADTRAALGPEDIVLVDTGALKMWMARLYPTYAAQHLPHLQRPLHHGLVGARGHRGQDRPARRARCWWPRVTAPSS